MLKKKLDIIENEKRKMDFNLSTLYKDEDRQEIITNKLFEKCSNLDKDLKNFQSLFSEKPNFKKPVLQNNIEKDSKIIEAPLSVSTFENKTKNYRPGGAEDTDADI